MPPLPSPPRAPWTALQRVRTPAVCATWQRFLGDAFMAFREAFLQRTGEYAACVPCPRDCGCAHEVVWRGPNEPVGICRCEPWNCDDLPLTPEAVALWSVSWPRLGRALCAALGLQSRPAELGLPHTRQVGAWSSASAPVLLTLGGERLSWLISQLALRLRRPFILLAATDSGLDVRAQELLAQAQAGCFVLGSCVELSGNGTLRPLVTPGELFARFSPQPKEALAEGAARQAIALVRALEAEPAARKAPLYTVFRLYCIEGFTVAQVARHCRCARSLVFVRLAALRRKLGADPRTFRQYSPHLERMEESLADPRARRVYRKGAAYGEEEADGAWPD
jgi:hypothetical protein